MNVEIVCSSRELFGADRCALRLAEVLTAAGASVRLVLPEQRPELGLMAEAEERRLGVDVRPVAIASSRGIEAPNALRPRSRSPRPDLTIFNSTAVLGAPRSASRRVLMVREWLEPRSPKHRLLALRHRVGLDAVVGISPDVLSQGRSCVRGPRVQALIPDWLDDAAIPPVAVTRDGREGLVCLGRFNQWKG